MNAFLSRPSATSVTVEEDVFWWWVSPFGLLGVLLGSALTAMGLGGERIVFDRV